MIVDSHCHLNCLKGADGLDGVKTYIDRAKEHDVSRFLCVSIDWESYPVVRNIAESFDEVYGSVGVHPNHDEGKEPSVEELVAEAANKNIIAIGETGLDYFRSEGDLDWQRERFMRHIEASKQCGKPLIIHTREAQKDTIDIMQRENARDAGGVMHCFTENWGMAKAALDMGFYISFSGIVTFKSAAELQQVARKVPLDRMLVETDSPYLAPVPHRGKQNEPAYTSHVVDFIAGLRDDSAENIAQQTTENFYRLFDKAERIQ
jgi:TatD DNase family protein